MRIEQLYRTNSVIIFILLVLGTMYIGASFLIPITFAIFLATLMLPVTNFLEKKTKLAKITSSLISTLIIFIAVGLIFFLLIHQLGVLVNDLVERRDEILQFVLGIQENLAAVFDISLDQQKQMLQDNLFAGINFFQSYLTNILSNILGIILKFLLVLIYLFLLLLNRKRFMDFLMMYTVEEKKEKTKRILDKTERVANYYLWGRVKVMTILAVMYLITFAAYGLEHMGLLIVFGAIITIIPYIGPFLSGLFPILFMIIFGHSSADVISFSIIIIIVQLIESYVLEPLIIGSEVKQNPLFIIIGVILGGMVWGIAGLILFVPLFAILKIVCDHTPELKPVGFILGYQKTAEGNGILEKIKKKFKK